MKRRSTRSRCRAMVVAALVGAGIFAGVFGVGEARADAPRAAPPSVESARESFDEAQALFDKGDFEGALARFWIAYLATGSPNAHLMMARSLNALGRAPAAYEAMAATLKEATALAESQPKYAPTRDAAAAELALMERRVGKLIIALAEPHPANVGVRLNGQAVDSHRIGQPIAVAPGVMVIEIMSNGSRVARRSIDVGAGETKTVALTVPKEGSEIAGEARAPLGPIARPAPASWGGAGSGVRMAGFALGGLGVAGMIVFGVAGAAADSKFSDLEKGCGRVRCTDPLYGPVVDTGKQLDAVANTGLAVGIVGLVSGGALIALGGSKSGPRAALSVGLSLTGAKVGLKGAF